jgi:hypothetical protein
LRKNKKKENRNKYSKSNKFPKAIYLFAARNISALHECSREIERNNFLENQEFSESATKIEK